MKLRIMLKEIAMPSALKKKEYGWRLSGSRKNPKDTTFNRIVEKIIEYIASNELDPQPNKENSNANISVKELLQDMREQESAKFTAAVDTININGGSGDSMSGYGGSAFYHPGKKEIEIKFPYGYGKDEYDIYMDVVHGQKKPNEEQFKAAVENKVKTLTTKGKKAPELPEFTNSLIVNKENLAEITKAKPKYKTQEDVNRIISLIRPDLKSSPNPAKRKNVEGTFKRIENDFIKLYHELTHAQQFGTPERIKQLNSFLKNETIPSLPLNRYIYRTNTQELEDEQRGTYDYGSTVSRGTPLGMFNYLVNPVEIDARINELRKQKRIIKTKAKIELHNSLKKSSTGSKEQAKQKYNDTIKNIPAIIFDMCKKSREYWANSLNVNRVDVNTDQIATNELRAKSKYQFYLQMSIDAKDIFESDSRYKEELDKCKKEVEDINSYIASLPNSTLKIDQQQKDKYRSYITNQAKEDVQDRTYNQIRKQQTAEKF